MKRILLLLPIFLCAIFANATKVAEDIVVSVITCSPGQEVYSLYGHTAIRVQDRRNGTDHVFNYGVFDFNTDYFVWKFILGHTDYICMASPWEYFTREYERRGSSVVAQRLNLTDSEAKKIADYLYRNISPENRTYRYNFLKNNCTTRVMDCIDSCIDGTLVYAWKDTLLTYRNILHEYTKDYPWIQDGNDLLLGADVDTVLSHRATCFIPDYYMNALSGAVVRNDFQDTRQLVASTDTLVRANHTVRHTENGFPLEPWKTGWLCFAISLIILLIEHYTRKMMWLLDAILMLSHGIAGCLILFMFCFSEHPAVDSNWLVGVLNPLPLILMPFTIKAAWHGHRSMWHYFMAVWLAVFLLFIPWMPQQMPLLLIPLLSTLLGRQVSYILHYSRMPASKLATNRKKAAKKKK